MWRPAIFILREDAHQAPACCHTAAVSRAHHQCVLTTPSIYPKKIIKLSPLCTDTD